jgi:hypothetical protein
VNADRNRKIQVVDNTIAVQVSKRKVGWKNDGACAKHVDEP